LNLLTDVFQTIPDILGDLYQFDESEMVWINLTNSTQGTIPIAREGHGFSRASDNKLYVFGGKSREGLINIICCVSKAEFTTCCLELENKAFIQLNADFV
jgi:hypothetical protein